MTAQEYVNMKFSGQAEWMENHTGEEMIEMGNAIIALAESMPNHIAETFVLRKKIMSTGNFLYTRGKSKSGAW